MNLPKAEIDKDTAMELWKSEHSEYAKAQLILSNIGLIGTVLKSFGLSVFDDDLYATGIVGLVKAVNTFDTEKGFKFSTYATATIRNEILMTFRKKRVDIFCSLDDLIDFENGSDATYADIISDRVSIEEDVISNMMIQSVLNQLSDKERKIIGLYSGGKTQGEISSLTGLSQSYVSRIIKGVRKKYGT